MTAIANGIAVYGGFIPYTATFLVFSDYARSAIRMAAIMKTQQIFVYTHDSIGLGEDGPTHQPVEHLASLRIMPNLTLWRPCDAPETAVAWQMAIENQTGPTVLALSRQSLPHCDRDAETLDNINKGGYVLYAPDTKPAAIIIATGSEIQIALAAAKQLGNIRVVSMPCVRQFDAQSDDYKQSVLPKNVPVFAIEAGIRSYWTKFTGNIDHVVGIDQFGESAPADKLFEHFGITVKHLCNVINKELS